MGELTIHQLHATYRMPRGIESVADAVRERLDRIAAAMLPIELDGLGTAHDPALYFIERMEVRVRSAPDRPDAAVSRAWGRAIDQGVARSIATDPSVVVFPDRVHYIAAYLIDLMHGRAGGVWYYKELGRGGNGVSTLLRERDVGRDALVLLAGRGELDRLLASLSDAAARDIVETCLLGDGPLVADATTIDAWTAALQQAGVPRTDVELIRVYCGCVAARPALGPDTNFARFLRCCQRIARQAGETPHDEAIWDDLKRGAGRPFRVWRPEGRWITQLLAAADGAARDRLAGILASQGPASAGVRQTHYTRIAGLMLLSRAMNELDLPAVFGPATAEGAALQRYAVALACVGRDDAVARRDPAVWLLAGLSAAPVPTHVTAAIGTVDVAAVADTVLRQFARPLGTFSDSSAPFLRENFIQGTGRIDVDPFLVHVLIEQCPLRVVLEMAGFTRHEWPMPWFGDRVVRVAFG